MGIPPVGGGVTQLPPIQPNVDPQASAEPLPEGSEAKAAQPGVPPEAAATPEAVGPSGASGSGDKTYTIAAGDTLSEIWQKQAKPLGVSYAEFKANNAHLFDDKHKRSNVKTQSQAGDYIKPGETVILVKAKVAEKAAETPPAQGPAAKSDFNAASKGPEGLPNIGQQTSANSAAWTDAIRQYQTELNNPAGPDSVPKNNPYKDVWIAEMTGGLTPSHIDGFFRRMEEELLTLGGSAGGGMELLQFFQTNRQVILNGLPPMAKQAAAAKLEGWMSAQAGEIAKSNKNVNHEFAAYATGVGGRGMPSVGEQAPVNAGELQRRSGVPTKP